MLDSTEVVIESLSDRDLIRMARAGNRNAYGELYRRYAPDGARPASCAGCAGIR